MATEMAGHGSAPAWRRHLRAMLQSGLAISLVIAGMAGFAEAASHIVTNTLDTGAGSLRTTIAGASAGDIITFSLPANSTITLTSGELAITLGLTIQGPGASLLTISGNHASRIFNVTAATTVSISGVTLRDGRPSGGVNGGGAILVNGGANAPGFYLTDAVVTNNDVSAAGTPLGGGIDNEGGSVIITRSSIVNNVATSRGGGIQNQGFGFMMIVNSTIAGNTAGTTGFGGGIRTFLPLTLINCTIYGNSAQTGGNISRSSNTVNLQDTIIAGGFLLGSGGAGPDINGAGFYSFDYNLIQDPTSGTITGITTHNLTGISPLLGYLGGAPPVMVPLAGSPVIDAGSASGSVDDQRGLPRPVDLPTYANASGGNASDIGAVEAQTAPLPILARILDLLLLD